MSTHQLESMDEGLLHHEGRHDVVAAVRDAISPSSKLLHTVITGHSERFFDEVVDAMEELPPYESVIAEEFVVDVTDCQGLSAHFACSLCDTVAFTHLINDFILFPSEDDEYSDKASSVPRCSTDDLPCSSRSSGTFPDESLSEAPKMSGQEAGPTFRIPYISQNVGQPGFQSRDSVIKWLCTTQETYSAQAPDTSRLCLSTSLEASAKERPSSDNSYNIGVDHCHHNQGGLREVRGPSTP
jgi:hypothetical protein